MKKYVLSLLMPILLSAQILSVSESRIDLGNVTTGISAQSQIYVINHSIDDVTLTDFGIFDPDLMVTTPVLTVPGLDSIALTVKFTAATNINYAPWFSIESDQADSALIVRVKAAGYFQDPWYISTQNLWAEDLKSALHALIAGHTDFGYSGARDIMFATIDNDNGTIESVYTGQQITAVNRTEAQNQGFNTEHTWPQGSFNSALPMRSDLYHLFPCDANSNSKRGSYPFGVVQNSTWSAGGSKLGTDAAGNIVFEPRDQQKGIAARALLYFLLRYQNAYNFYNYNGTWFPMTTEQESLMRSWSGSFPVSLKESARNDAIFSYQTNRNPFIDHPEFLDRISSLIATAVQPSVVRVNAAPEILEFGAVEAGQSRTKFLTLINSGNVDQGILSVSASNPEFTIGGHPGAVPAGQFIRIPILFNPLQPDQNYSAQISVTLDDVSLSITVSGNGSVTTLPDISNPVPAELSLHTYPNPFNAVTRLNFSLPEDGPVQMEIYSIQGRRVKNWQWDSLQRGMHHVLWQADNQPSGTYLLHIKTAMSQINSKLILLK